MQRHALPAALTTLEHPRQQKKPAMAPDLVANQLAHDSTHADCTLTRAPLPTRYGQTGLHREASHSQIQWSKSGRPLGRDWPDGRLSPAGAGAPALDCAVYGSGGRGFARWLNLRSSLHICSRSETRSRARYTSRPRRSSSAVVAKPLRPSATGCRGAGSENICSSKFRYGRCRQLAAETRAAVRRPFLSGGGLRFRASGRRHCRPPERGSRTRRDLRSPRRPTCRRARRLALAPSPSLLVRWAA